MTTHLGTELALFQSLEAGQWRCVLTHLTPAQRSGDELLQSPRQ